MSRSELEAELLAEVIRIVGDEGGATHFHALRRDAALTDADLRTALSRLRRLPSGIRREEIEQRLGALEEE